MTIRVVRATFDHALQVAEHMREDDRREVWASSRMTPWESTTDCLRVSTSAWCGLSEGMPVCIFGVAPVNLIAGVGSPWMLGTDELADKPISALRHCRPYVGRMLRVYSRLENYVDDRNEKSKEWLRWLGFTLEEPRPYGHAGVMFRPFSLELSSHV